MSKPVLPPKPQLPELPWWTHPLFVILVNVAALTLGFAAWFLTR